MISEILLWIIAAFCVLNTFFLTAIAGSLAKLVGYMRDESTVPVDASRQESQLVDLPDGPLFRMENGELVQVSGPTYDQSVFSGKKDPFSDGVVARPSVKNWDGVPSSVEE